MSGQGFQLYEYPHIQNRPRCIDYVRIKGPLSKLRKRDMHGAIIVCIDHGNGPVFMGCIITDKCLTELIAVVYLPSWLAPYKEGGF